MCGSAARSPERARAPVRYAHVHPRTRTLGGSVVAFDLGLAAGGRPLRVVGRDRGRRPCGWPRCTRRLARGLLRDGRSPLVVVVVTVLAAGVGAMHFLVRPHLLTFVFFWVRCGPASGSTSAGVGRRRRAVPDGGLGERARGVPGRTGDRVDGARSGTRRPARGTPRGRRTWRGSGSSFVLSCLAPLANPYGLGLYRHVGRVAGIERGDGADRRVSAGPVRQGERPRSWSGSCWPWWRCRASRGPG